MGLHNEIIDKIKPEFKKATDFLDGELTKIRTGRASPALIENLEIEYFGQKLPLKQLGMISCPEPRQIVIQPWDKSYVEAIQKAISQSSLGLSPIVDKDFIRLSLPPLSEEYRKNLMRILSEKQEEARKIIRRWREEAWKKIQDGFREGKIREDDKFRAKDELQKLVDDYNKKIDEMGEKKKKDIIE
jgi:ribosome recycling factor